MPDKNIFTLGVPVLVLQSRNRSDVRRTLHVLAQLLGAPDRAEAQWVQIQAAVLRAARTVPAASKGKRVYLEVDATPYAAGPTSLVGETLTALGMLNAAPATLGPFPKLGAEFVVRSQPDIIMAAERDLAQMPRRPGWGALRALQNHQTCGFASARFALIVRPGPRMGEAAQLLADCLARITPAPG